MPSRWERGAGVTQLTGWVHLPLQREVAPGALGERPLQLRPARMPTALPALEPQKRLGLSRRADQGWGAESAATDTPNLKFWAPPPRAHRLTGFVCLTHSSPHPPSSP